MRQVNLLPEKLQKADQLKSTQKTAAAIIGFAFVALLLVHFFLVRGIRQLEGMVSQPDYLFKRPEIKELNQKLTKIRKEQQGFIKNNQGILTILDNYFSYSQILKMMGGITAERVWLSGITIDSKERIFEIEGRSFNTRLVSEFMLGLKKMAYFETVNLSSMEKGTESENKEIVFKIICQLK